MKKYIILPMMAVALAGYAQDFDNEPTVNLQKDDMKFTVGARMMADVVRRLTGRRTHPHVVHL